VLFDLAEFPFGTRERVLQEVEALAMRGLRSVGVITVSLNELELFETEV
jgi:hypothetical protein